MLCLPQCAGNRVVHWVRKVRLGRSNSVLYTCDCGQCLTYIDVEEFMIFQAILNSPLKILYVLGLRVGGGLLPVCPEDGERGLRKTNLTFSSFPVS
jgi:hypothetical protein